MLKIVSLLTLTMLNFLNGIIHLTFLAFSIIIFRDLKLVSQLYRAWSDCMDVLAGLALYLVKKGEGVYYGRGIYYRIYDKYNI